MATVIYTNGKSKTVKNLGWLRARIAKEEPLYIDFKNPVNTNFKVLLEVTFKDCVYSIEVVSLWNCTIWLRKIKKIRWNFSLNTIIAKNLEKFAHQNSNKNNDKN
ncbi:MAG: hypothetical protein IM526_12810 [Microcystis sp. M38BS1]|uniref:hypothetical protein n=1 Tax=Microcystis sp. M38BS1 TaxID=2771188 RepID=UPI0031FCDD7C|nr:hypothetical protein [Microcystis sp. M38BS1]MCA6584462.1 hypothetical protein [Pseudanabaena sp. M34BS1SP1A06MG]